MRGSGLTFVSMTKAFAQCVCILACVLALTSAALADTTSSISSNFNGTGIAGGNTIWFTSVMKPSGLGNSPVTIFVRKGTITFTANGTNYTVPVPDANVTFSPSATSATISFDTTKNLWQITVPSTGLAGNTLLDAAEFAVPSGGLPGGINNVTWQANFSTDTPGISMQWQWAAAVYTSFSADYTSVGVKPVDDNKASQYQNSDHAGTPENYKPYVIGGARGGGGSNYTGSYSGTVGLTVPVVQAPTANAGGPYSAYVGQPITFNGGASTDPDGYALNYNWNFGDVTTGTGSTATHTYSSAGTFNVSLTIDDGRDITATATVAVTLALPPPPVISATLTPAPNATGWNNSAVTVSFTCSDSNVGIRSCPSPISVTATGANQVAEGTATDNAGVTSTATVKVSIDETPPTITASLAPIPDSSGWNNSDVTVSFNCSDSLSGIAQCPQPVLVSSSGANQVVTGTATDQAGNTSSTSVTLNVELTLPSIVAAVSPPPNAQGWNNTNVTLSFTCSQSTSPITSCPPQQIISSEGAGQVVSGTVTDAANNNNTAQVTLNIAKTPPTISASASPQSNTNGWNNSAVTISFACTKTVAPLATCSQPQTITAEGANQTVSGTATDAAGNSASAAVLVNIATTPPKITASVSPQPNANGWNNSAVTVTFNCTATTAPIASCPQPQTISTEGANQTVTGTVADVAGNTATAQVALNIALTPPTITASGSPAPNANGWNNSAVTVSFVCTRTTAPIATCPPAQTISTEGVNQTVSGTVTDLAGNTSKASLTLNIGTQPPTIVASVSPAPNAAGWNNTNVTVSFTCAAGTAPVAVCPSPVTVSTEGANQLISGTATDVAGNSASNGVTVNIDKTPPTITASASTSADSQGWNDSAVTVTFTCSDSVSGVANCPSPQTVSAEGANQVVSGTATDTAGNTASTSITLNIETTPPTITASASPAPNAGGWNNSDVTVTFVCQDSVSGIAICPAPITASNEGANQQICGQALNNAGVSATACSTVSIDKTPPSVTATATPPPNSNGWNNTSVTVSFSCADNLSGVASCPPSQQVSTEGANQTISGTATDNAGNTSAPAQVTLNIETTPPTITGFTAPTQLSPGQSGTATLTATDDIGVTSVVFELNGTSISTLTVPPYSANFTVPSTANAGDTLTLTVIVSDAAGNATSASRGIQVVYSGVVVGQVLSDLTGLPLSGATVQVAGGTGQATTDAGGRYSIPSTSSNLFLTFNMPANPATNTPAMITVEREVSIQQGVGTVPVDARMTAMAAPQSVDSGGGTVGSGSITVTVPSGAVSAATNFYLTLLSQQGIPALLPLGWSPVSAFDLRSDVQPSASMTADFTTLPSVPLDLVVYDYNVHAWMMVAPNLTASKGTLATTLAATGSYALVTPDPGNTAIQVPPAGQPLTGVPMVTVPVSATTSGGLSPANVAPTGGTSTASLALQSTTPVPSGTVLQAEVTETYSLSTGGKSEAAPRYEDLVLYQVPAPSGATAAATFPVTPSQTFQPGQITSGDVHLDILAGRESVRGSTGGSDAVSVQGGGATLTVAAGSLPQDTAIAVNSEGIDTLLPSTTAVTALAEYNIDLSGQVLNLPAQLTIPAGNAQAGSTFIVALVQRVNGVPYLEAVSLAQLNGSNLVTQTTAGFPGVIQGGDYVFYQISSPIGFVSGTVTASSGPIAAMVSSNGLPFVAFSTSSGNYTVPSVPGTANLTASVPNTALAGTASTTVVAGETATANISVTGQVESATVTPPNGAVGVPLTAEIDVTAPVSFNPVTVTTSSVSLTQNGTNTPIPVRFVFSGGGTRLSVFPQSALQPSTSYTLSASGIADSLGGLIVVPTTSFTTQSTAAANFNTDALIFAMPDQNGNVQVSAPANSFPPGSTILIVDQTNGVVVSLTVANDGSVSGQMPATIDDVLTATITAPDKTTATFTVSKFVAADGTTAIGSGGGTVTGPGNIAMIIPQGALTKGTTFKLAPLDQTAFPQLPSWGSLNFGSGMQITAPAMPSFNKEVKLAFPVPANAPAGAFYYVFRRLTDSNGNILWETIDEAFVQGTGANAQVVTASPPFCGYMNSYGSFQTVAAASYQPLQTAIVTTFMMWDYNPNQAGIASPGLIEGRIFTNGSSGNLVPLTTGTVTVVLKDNPQYVTTSSPVCETYSLFDPELGGGARNVTATYDTTGQTINATAYEVNGVQPDDNLYSVTAGLESRYQNIGRLNFTFAPPVPPPPPPQINIGIYTLDASGDREPISGIVQVNTPLTIAFSSTQQVRTASINGASYSAVVADTPPANANPNLSYFRLNNPYTPATAGVYTVTATALDPLQPNAPIDVSRSFLAVAAGGGNTTVIAGANPTVIGTVPDPNASSVSASVFPEITFSEPVTNVSGNVTLSGNLGDTPTLLLIGIRSDGSVADPVQANDVITSLTVQPVTGLEYGDTYTLTLNGNIESAPDSNGAQLPLSPAPYSLKFTTLGPQQLGGTSSQNQLITKPTVIGQMAYAAARVGQVGTGLEMFDVSNPTEPIDDGLVASAVGIPADISGVAQSPVTGGGLIAVSTSTALDVALPGNVWLYKVPSNPQQAQTQPPVLVGGVSVTPSAVQAGFASRIFMKDGYLYTFTILQGLQVVDLNQVVQEYASVTSTPQGRTQFGQAMSTEGDGFAADTVINTIPLPRPNGGTFFMSGLTGDDFVTTGSSGAAPTAALLAATGSLPFVLANPNLSAPAAVLYPPMVNGGLSQAPMTDANGDQLINGRAVALGIIPVTDSSGNSSIKHVAVVVGTGIPSGGTLTSVLSVIDVSQPYTPGQAFTPTMIGFLVLPQGGMDVVLSGSVALVSTSTDVQLVNLADPTHPELAGQIQGDFGMWLALSGSGTLIGDVTAVASTGIETAGLNGVLPPPLPNMGHCPKRDCVSVAGDPVNLTNGNVYVDQTDYSVPGLGGGIQLSRTWNSLWTSSSPVEISGTFGNSWRSTYEERLQLPQTVPGQTSMVKYWRGDGSVWYFQPAQSGGLYTVSSPLNEHATLQIGATGETIAFADGTKETFNVAGYMTALIDRNGNQTTINYDSLNRIASVTDEGGQSLTFNYSGSSPQVQSIQDAAGVVATYAYDAAAHLTKVTYADGSSLNMTYDSSDNLLSVADGNGKLLQGYTYDSLHRDLTWTRASGVDNLSISYPSTGQTRVTNSQNVSTAYGSGRFGGRGIVTGITGPGCSSCGGRNNSTFDYDGSGNRVSSTDALGRITKYSYDSQGNVLSVTANANSNASVTWRYTYNPFSEILTATDPMGNTTTNDYDSKGNLLSVSSPKPGSGIAPSVTQFAYNSMGELTKITDPLNNATALTYNSAGLIQTITDAQGNVTTYGYDARDNRTSVKDALGNTTTFAYDAMNRLTQITYPDSTTTKFTYDDRGRRTSVTDQNGKVTKYAYDDADRLISVTDAAGNTTTYGYDTENNVTSITDASGNTTSFAYDSLGRVTQTTFPSGLTETYGYDAVGNLTGKTDRKGQTITYAYDGLDRLIKRTFPDSTAVNYTYDADSRLTQVTDPTGTYQFTFDNMGRLVGTSTQYSFLPNRTFSTSDAYDMASNRIGFTDPEGGATAYAYDALNQLKTLTPPSAFTAGTPSTNFGFNYDALGRRTQMTRPNGVTTNYTYDNLSRLLSVLHQLNGTTIDGASYTVDAVGNRTSKTDQRTGVVTNYGYDAIYRLLSATQGGSTTESYTYDPVGNRLSSLGVAQYNYNSSSELTSTSNGSYTYDANGNTLTDAAGRTYTWDFQNQLTKVVMPGGATVNFKYDPFGRRIYKSSGASTTIYAYDGDNVVETTDQTGAVVSRFAHGENVDEPLAQLRSGTTNFFEADGLGSVTSLTNSSGTLSQTYAYDSFGNVTSSSGGVANTFQYTGREFDSETGLYFYRARYYDPQAGRFLSQDPLGLAGGPSLYTYVGGGPVNWVDPYGAKRCGQRPIRVGCTAHPDADIYELNDVVTVEAETVTTIVSGGNRVNVVTTTQAFFSAKEGHEGAFLGARQTVFTGSIFNRTQRDITLLEASTILGCKAIEKATQATAPGFGGELSRDIRARPWWYLFQVVTIAGPEVLELPVEARATFTAIHAIDTALDLNKEAENSQRQ